jgi:hypothetical protein
MSNRIYTRFNSGDVVSDGFSVFLDGFKRFTRVCERCCVRAPVPELTLQVARVHSAAASSHRAVALHI